MIVDSDTTKPILGLESCVELGMVKQLESVECRESSEKILDDVKYKLVFEGLGCIKGVTYDAKMKPDVAPVINPPRRVPHPMLKRLKSSLDKLVKQDIIEPITEPTEWVSSLVIAEKNSGELRLCIDPRSLNKGIMREHFPMRTVEDVAACLTGKKVFSVLDAGQAFYQIQASDQTAKLLTFNSPFGRYKFKRMPFGLSSAPEVWERTITSLLSDIDGVEIVRNDILAAGETKDEHDAVLRKVFDRALECGLGLNRKKCRIAVDSVVYQGHIFSSFGIQIDPEKVSAITSYKTPENVDDVTRWLGMVTYVGKFIPDLSRKAAPLRLLQNAETAWHWDKPQQDAFEQLKCDVASTPVLNFYSCEAPVTVSVDASAYGLGACLLQGGKPVAYASRSLTASEKNYGQIEKEMLAIQWGCTKFHDYIYGLESVTVETDHKPIEALYRKPLSAAPPRIQRMQLKLQKYALKVFWKKGTELVMADSLSRAPVVSCDDNSDVDEYEVHSVGYLPISDIRMNELKQVTSDDMTL